MQVGFLDFYGSVLDVAQQRAALLVSRPRMFRSMQL
jgi:hypothetical protein